MDNRTDVSEDLQSTPEHPAAKRPGESGLTAGPHNDPPPTRGVEGTYRATAGPGSQSSLWSGMRRSLAGSPMQLALSALGVTLILLALRGLRSR